MSMRLSVAGAMVAASFITAASASQTTYRPAVSARPYSQGFSEQQLDPGRFRVTFAGNAETPRDAVERSVVLRSAELALQQGYRSFQVVTLDTKQQTQTLSTGGTPASFKNSYAGIYRPVSNRFSRLGGFDEPEAYKIRRFEATAEVVMRNDATPRGDAQLFDARHVVQTFGPTVARSD